MGILDGKRALVVGVASNKSIAWGIASARHRQGAELAFTYQTERLRGRVDKIADECGSSLTMPCDLASDADIDKVFERLGNDWGNIDIVVHSAAYAPREELAGEYLESVTREGFGVAHDISSY
ncbi:MAG: SDR family oxidoreductase, partial [Gammaproteobacteria bacterium]|nr:SDR family oxidoreductase [Gammaproteobacteria bacterium]